MILCTPGYQSYYQAAHFVYICKEREKKSKKPSFLHLSNNMHHFSHILSSSPTFHRLMEKVPCVSPCPISNHNIVCQQRSRFLHPQKQFLRMIPRFSVVGGASQATADSVVTVVVDVSTALTPNSEKKFGKQNLSTAGAFFLRSRTYQPGRLLARLSRTRQQPTRKRFSET